MSRCAGRRWLPERAGRRLRPFALTAALVVAAGFGWGCGGSGEPTDPGGDSDAGVRGSAVGPAKSGASSKAPDPSAEAAELPPEIIEELRACPTGEEPWKTALERATELHATERLRELAEDLTRSCADRWEPPWTVAECIIKRNPTIPPEIARDARGPFEQALERATAGSDPVGVSRNANRLAWCLYTIGDLQTAEELYRRSIAAATRAGREDLAGLAHSNFARLLARRGEHAAALESMNAASESITRAADPGKTFRFSYNRAIFLGDLGHVSEKRRVLERLYDEAPGAGMTSALPNICIALGNVHLAFDEREKAASWYARVPDDHPLRPFAALGSGRLAIRNDDYEEAARHLDLAIASDATRDLPLFARAFRAEADFRSGRLEEARERLESLVEEADERDALDVACMARTLYGKVLAANSEFAAAELYLRQAIESIERAGEGLDPESSGIAYLRERAEPFPELAAALARQGDDRRTPEILRVVERAHSRALKQILLSAEAGTPAVSSPAALQSALGEGELLLDFLIGQDRGVIVAIDRSEVRVHLLPGWSELRDRVRRYTSALRRPLISAEARVNPDKDLERDLAGGHELYRLLLGPADTMVARARRLYIVPDQDLALLPFAALPAREPGTSPDATALQYLGEQKEIALMPMAGLPQPQRGSLAPLLLAGDPLPDPGGEFGALPLARQELSGIEHVWSGERSTRLEGESLSVGRFRNLALDSFQMLHFATHAVASSRDPDRCAVMFSGGERLGLREIAELQLGSALVVLSACQTGGGEVIPGEGVVGLTWAFLRAGARGVVASLWSVEDASTMELMLAFHRGLRAGEDPVRALSAAQRELARSRRHPVYWAPFVVVLGPRPAD